MHRENTELNKTTEMMQEIVELESNSGAEEHTTQVKTFLEDFIRHKKESEHLRRLIWNY